MASSILLSVEQDHVSAAPGASVEFSVSVQNLTTLLDQVALRVEGIEADWVQIVPPYLPVFAQGAASARIIISPPNSASRSLAGAYPFRVVGASQEHAGQEGSADVTLDVQLIGDYQMRITGTRPTSTPQELIFLLTAQNSANASAQLRLTGGDKGDELWYKFEPFQLNVPAGGEAKATLTARVKQLTNDRRAIAFNISASGNYVLRDDAQIAAPAHEIAGQFVQSALAVLTLSISPTQLETELSGMYQLRVGNPGTIPVTARLAGTDDEGALAFRFDPPQISLGAQSEARAMLAVQADAPLQAGGPRTRTFRVSAVTTDGLAQPASAEGRLIQVTAKKPFPWALVIGVGAIALLLLCALMVLVVVNLPR